ncbi:MAG: 16S rRNA (adenine(1518)-N(6)/adenine(1519)-N(6))-dimethyltransferase RsmA [bacterium]|nr:16S rRNA (adenine(1518)-N(6)/adenine(1519)-N(6))-dimethyltransferase RsmA [bacterium]
MPSISWQLLEHGVNPKHHRGQNFLIDKNILHKIVDAADIKKTDVIVEIGAGLGTLTCELAKKAKKVFAVEIDKDLLPLLKENTAAYRNVTIIKDDALEVSLSRYGKKDGSYKVVANIPYHITSRLIRLFLEEHPKPSSLVLLIQKEVAQRIGAKPPHSSLLSLSVQYYAEPRILFSVSRNCFSPKPNVESAVIRLDVIPSSHLPKQTEQDAFFRLIKAGFAAKRKFLANNLASGLDISPVTIREAFLTLHISEKARAQELSLEQWKLLSAMLA